MKPSDEQDDGPHQKTFHVGELVDVIGYGYFQHVLMFQCGMVWMADAMEMMLMSYLLPRVKQEWNLSKTEEADIMTFTFFGMLIGNGLCRRHHHLQHSDPTDSPPPSVNLETRVLTELQAPTAGGSSPTCLAGAEAIWRPAPSPAASGSAVASRRTCTR